MEDNNISNPTALDLSVYEQKVSDPLKSSIKKGLKEGFKSIFSSKTFADSRVPLAYQAHLKSKYGTVNTNEKRMDTFMTSIATSIEAKNTMNEYSLIKEIPDDLVEYKETIIHYFKARGYITHDLAEVIPNLSHSYLVIIWDNFKLTQEELMKNNLEKVE